MISKLRKADDPLAISKAADLLGKGGIIIHPTETIYGFAANALLPNAVRRVDRIKGRKSGETYLLLMRDTAMAVDHKILFDRMAQKLATRFWPGPLTLVLPVDKESQLWPLARHGTLGIRVSSKPSIKKLFQAIDFPLVSTSVNHSGREPLRDPAKMEDAFGREVDLILEKGVLPERKASTIVAVHDNAIEILRKGAVTEKEVYGL